MSDEYYSKEVEENGFFSEEEEAHFYSVISDYVELLDKYDSNFILLTIYQMVTDKDNKGTLSSLN